jgi:hemoglobin-like flavoprotein
MNEYTISLVRESFDLVEPIAAQAGAMLNANMLEIDPSMHAVFTQAIGVPGEQLMTFIGASAAHLDEPETLMPLLDDLGRRLAAAGGHSPHYDTFRAALLKTLYEVLGVAYNDAVEEAWIDAYGEVAQRMKSAVAAAPVST